MRETQESEHIVNGENLVLNDNRNGRTPQIWDFKLGLLRSQEECYPPKHDLTSLNNNDSNNPGASGPATCESNNLPIPKPSSGSTFGKHTDSSSSSDLNFTEQPLIVRPVDQAKPTTAVNKAADRELLAQSRGNAMQRYKKKKTRSYKSTHLHYN